MFHKHIKVVDTSSWQHIGITRLIAKLRAHKLVRKIIHSFKYQLTKLGHEVCYKILKFKKLELVTP